MDAMQKRRMKNLARIHFGLTLFFVFLSVIWNAFPFHSQSIEARVIHATWGQFWLDALKLLQPLPHLMILVTQRLNLPDHPLWLVVLIIYGALLVASLFWSICFSWILVKFDNWLNHFPVLGKKVF
jgi:hypothetical protein